MQHPMARYGMALDLPTMTSTNETHVPRLGTLYEFSCLNESWSCGNRS